MEIPNVFFTVLDFVNVQAGCEKKLWEFAAAGPIRGSVVRGLAFAAPKRSLSQNVFSAPRVHPWVSGPVWIITGRRGFLDPD